MLHDQDIISASTRLFSDANEVIAIMQKVREINKECWKMTTADISKIEESIQQLAKAQAVLRKVRETATTRIAS